MNIQVNILTLDQAVNRQLAAIGKRARNAEGKSIFSDITPSSAEIETIHDFYADAVTLLNTTSQYFVEATTTPTEDGQAIGVVTLTFPNNHNIAMNTTLVVAFTTFLVAYAVYAWLSIVNPAATERYQQAMREKLEALIQIIFHKTPPNHEYVLDVPPSISSPGSLRLGFNEQRIIAYTLGSDGIDDLEIVSSSEYITVYKNADRTFSIINANTTANPVVATVTIRRGETTILEVIAVTALTQSAGATIVTNPILIGLRTLSDSIELQTGDTRKITYTGTITSIAPSSNLAAAELITENGQTKILITAGANAGRETFILYGANGWSYTLYCNVKEQQATLPKINHSSLAAIRVNETFDIPYTLGSDNFDDIYMTASNSAVTLQKVVTPASGSTPASYKYVVTGVNVGSATIRVTSARHPEINTYITVRVTAVHGLQEPHIYVTENTINTVAGADPTRILFYPGETGEFTVTSSDSTKVAVYKGNGYVDIKPLAATAAGSPVTITFTNNATEFQDNSHNNWMQTISVSVAAIPAVITPPIIYWPDSLVLKEGSIGISVEYALGNDSVDGFTTLNGGGCSSSNTNVVTIAQTSNGFNITPHGIGSATIHIWDILHGIDVYKNVVVEWREPELLNGLRDNDELYLPEVYEPASGFDASDTDTNPTIGTNGLAIEFKAASSGTYSYNVYPSGCAVCRIDTIQNIGGPYTKKLVVFALEEGLTYITVRCDSASGNSWSSRFILRVGQAAADTPTLQSPDISFSDFYFKATSRDHEGRCPILTNTRYLPVTYSSSNTSVATVDRTTGAVTFVGNGTTIISAAFAGNDTYYAFTAQYRLDVDVEWGVQEFTANDSDGVYYYKGTIEGVTNPIFMYDSLGTGAVVLFTNSDGDSLYCYDESEEEYYLDTQNTVDSTALGNIETAVMDALSRYEVSVSAHTSTNSVPSEYPSAYILPIPSSMQPTEISNSAPDGLYYLKGTVGSVGRITNPVFSLSNGTITLFTDSDGAATYVYDETTGEVTASSSVGSTNLEYAIWSIYYTLLSYVSGASFNRQTSVGTPSGTPTHFINKVTPTLNGSTSRNVVINDYNTISVNNDAVYSALSSDDSIASVEADVGSAFVTALATGTATITIVTLTGEQFTITYTVTATLLPSIDGNTSRSLTVGNTDTISVNNGTISSVSVSPSSGTLTANLSNGSVVVTGVGAGSATVTITTTDNTTLTVTYTVSAAASNTITAYSGQRNVFAYLNKTVTVDAGIPLTVENPIVYIDNDGYVYAVSDNSNYLLKYNTSSNQVEQGPYCPSSNNSRPQIICDAAVADYGTLVEKNNDYRKYFATSNVLVLYSISSSQGQANPGGNAGGGA